MRKLAIVGALGAALLVPAGADARTEFDTDLNVLGTYEYPTDQVLTYGVLLSDVKKCVKGREMTGYYDDGSGFEIVDEGVSTKTGSWALSFPNGVGVYKIKAAKRKVGSDVCLAETYTAS